MAENDEYSMQNTVLYPLRSEGFKIPPSYDETQIPGSPTKKFVGAWTINYRERAK